MLIPAGLSIVSVLGLIVLGVHKFKNDFVQVCQPVGTDDRQLQ